MPGSTISLLRFPFSFFLMPVFMFALTTSTGIITFNAIYIFFILHALVYPASNGYNSYMDRDTGSIGGLEKPPLPTRRLYVVTIIMDIIAVLASLVVGAGFAAGIVLYILASRAYSYRGIRLKGHPVIGYLTVILFQGTWIYMLVKYGVTDVISMSHDVVGMIAAALLVGGFYPLTQVYQHKQDKEDGVITISSVLGYRGTFLFTAIIFPLALLCIAIKLIEMNSTEYFLAFASFFVPVLVYFNWWFLKVLQQHSNANYKNTMRMNLIASICTNAAFIYLYIATH